MKKIIAVFIIALATVFVLPDEKRASGLLHNGSAGDEVKDVQHVLTQLGYFSSNQTGYYGPQTTEAVRAFQGDFGLLQDGIAGPGTMKKISNVEVLAKVVHGEARGESYEGKVAVAAVVLNRVGDNEFPSDVKGVVFQRNAFTAVLDGQYNLTPERDAYRAVRDAYTGWDPSKGSTYYYNPDIATSSWIFTRSPVVTIGKHIFAE
ncbi:MULTISPECIES: cell wall hydrolase [Alteribacter]|uniref:Cell wall hydrolase n=1 Tax=Alteribacter keqinensis TaxID=2483800 RepID=A0A3M7TY20_9BACI|nr:MULTISPECIES: cell wall hydrolase [Alteribacter]MBM7096277.1 cell wall hydrolase [Alteribacter salitolerans]RNA70498.1 cell wall hydrolase [Alteribacter keqinensis]